MADSPTYGGNFSINARRCERWALVIEGGCEKNVKILLTGFVPQLNPRNSYFFPHWKDRWWDKYLGFYGIFSKYLIDCGFQFCLHFGDSSKNILLLYTCESQHEIDSVVKEFILDL